MVSGVPGPPRDRKSEKTGPHSSTKASDAIPLQEIGVVSIDYVHVSAFSAFTTEGEHGDENTMINGGIFGIFATTALNSPSPDFFLNSVLSPLLSSVLSVVSPFMWMYFKDTTLRILGI